MRIAQTIIVSTSTVCGIEAVYDKCGCGKRYVGSVAPA